MKGKRLEDIALEVSYREMKWNDRNKILWESPKFNNLNDKEKAKYVKKATKINIEHDLKIQSYLTHRLVYKLTNMFSLLSS